MGREYKDSLAEAEQVLVAQGVAEVESCVGDHFTLLAQKGVILIVALIVDASEPSEWLELPLGLELELELELGRGLGLGRGAGRESFIRGEGVILNAPDQVDAIHSGISRFGWQAEVLPIAHLRQQKKHDAAIVGA